MQAIGFGIGLNTNLRYLDLRGNCLFKLDRHNIIREHMDHTAVNILAKSIQENAANGGVLTTLNITNNLMKLGEARKCEFGIDMSELAEITDHNEKISQRLASVISLISAAKEHPTLQSLCGIHPYPENPGYPGSNNLNNFLKKNEKKMFEKKIVLNLCNQGIDDLMAMVISYDLKNNHNVMSLNIEDNCITYKGKNSIINSIKDNVTLKSVYLNYQNLQLPNSRNLKIEDKVKIILDSAKNLSFQYRIAIAVFIRGTYVFIYLYVYRCVRSHEFLYRRQIHDNFNLYMNKCIHIYE
jgi:hypothetical protein